VGRVVRPARAHTPAAHDSNAAANCLCHFMSTSACCRAFVVVHALSQAQALPGTLPVSRSPSPRPLSLALRSLACSPFPRLPSFKTHSEISRSHSRTFAPHTSCPFPPLGSDRNPWHKTTESWMKPSPSFLQVPRRPNSESERAALGPGQWIC
jgi:hypothetical protein